MSAEPQSVTHPGSHSNPVTNAGSDSSTLACSRCDGPVNSDDLVDGLAVRIDGLTVCALCIETLSPALRIQINRVRALKGLAVVTYRVVRSEHPDHHFYSFTSAGLLLLHRRALVHGTEFDTPDLPANHRPSLLASGAPQVATVQIRSAPPERRKLLLLVGLAAAGVMVIGGLIAVAFSSGAPHSAGKPASPNQATEPAALTSGNPATLTPSPLPALLPGTPDIEAPAKRELKDYRIQFPDEISALQAGLADEAAPELIAALERDVAARGRTQVERLRRILQQPSLGRRELDEIDAVLAKAEPPDRPALADLRQTLSELAEIARNKRGLIPAIVTMPSPEPVVEPVVEPITAPTQETPLVAPIPEAPIAIPEPPPKSDLDPIEPKITLWSSELGPKPATFVELTDTTTRIPSPWPFFIGERPPQFAAAIKIRTSERKEIYALHLTFPAEQVRNGGIFLTLHPKIGRKELLVTRIDQPAEPQQRLTFADRENWRGFAYRVNEVEGDSVTIQIADVGEVSSDPFWLGATAAIANGDPASLASEISASPLLMPNPLMDWKPQLESLKAAARGRRLEAKWYDPKSLNTSAIKILGPDTVSATKLNATLRTRREMPDVTNQIEVVNLLDANEIRKLFAPKANPGLFNQKIIPSTVFLVTNGTEATMTPADWAKHVRWVNELFRVGEPKLPATGFVPVWVIGTLDGSPLSTLSWSLLRNDRSVILIDLTSTSAEGTASQRKARSDTYNYLAEGISTVMYQLRLVQIVQRSR